MAAISCASAAPPGQPASTSTSRPSPPSRSTSASPRASSSAATAPSPPANSANSPSRISRPNSPRSSRVDPGLTLPTSGADVSGSRRGRVCDQSAEHEADELVALGAWGASGSGRLAWVEQELEDQVGVQPGVGVGVDCVAGDGVGQDLFEDLVELAERLVGGRHDLG